MCRDCGYTLKCKRCNISLTYHEYTNTLKCHYCGYEINNVTTCPSCKSNNIDILIGTQMVVKGHHFPNVNLVGVIAADGSLNIEDYRANERTFDLLTQVARKSRKRIK